MTLEEIKDEFALQHYMTPNWMLLSDSQKANLVDVVAIKYAMQEVKEFSESVNRIFN